MKTRHTLVDTVLGPLTVAASGEAVVGIYFPDHWYQPAEGSLGPRVDARDDVLFDAVRSQLTEYLAGERTAFDLPTATAGNPLQERVWAVLRGIPYGGTTTYGEIAAELGDRAFAQAVGQANGHNPISIVVPCHRVVGRNGQLTGYAGGLWRKQFLLELEEPEAVKAARLF